MRRILLLVTAVITVLALSGIKAEAKSEKASVMSFNIRIQFPADTGKYNWESRKAGCVKAIRKYLPDIIGLQEAAPGQKSFLMNELKKYIMIDGNGNPEPSIRIPSSASTRSSFLPTGSSCWTTAHSGSTRTKLPKKRLGR